MTRKIQFFVSIAKALTPVAVICIVAINGRAWLGKWFGLYISQELYFWIAYLLVATTIWPATRKCVGVIRSELQGNDDGATGRESPKVTYVSNNGEATYRYPLHIVGLVVVVSILMAMAPIIIARPGNSIPLTGYLISFGFSAVLLVYAIYLLRFYVRIDGAILVVGGISRREFILSNIVDINFRQFKGSPQLTIKFSNGDRCVISGLLKNFSELEGKLRTNARDS
ncbi:hypothetical protein [Paraburkholderia unamae]|uniref:PH (Pleckstrin Homology) domain-containing protein n=1 Tax=Paraburkholderia unamae TaxID=219649 RepID=A0ABX5KIK8_9BURK|nr:hypothetical protein [Paraburkholderia unamae]PVX81242.1 hypothetical protein C7402_111144 [Paraburkholderia unamae]